jgi:hypothetical protein
VSSSLSVIRQYLFHYISAGKGVKESYVRSVIPYGKQLKNPREREIQIYRRRLQRVYQMSEEAISLAMLPSVIRKLVGTCFIIQKLV